jgi:protein subunit release factor A
MNNVFDLKDVEITVMRSRGKGGQNVNKVNSAVRAIHKPTNIPVRIDGRDQGQNKKKALQQLEIKVTKHYESIKAAKKKASRDIKIKDKRYIRTYDYKSQRVKDHRTGKTASLDEVLTKGRIDLLH